MIAGALTAIALLGSPVGPGDFLSHEKTSDVFSSPSVAAMDREKTSDVFSAAQAEEPDPDDPFADQRRVVPFPPIIYYDRRPDRQSEIGRAHV